MKKEFCTYEQSLTLKELGYPQDEYFKCYTVHQNGYMSLCSQKLYLDEVSSPLIQQALQFFVENYDMCGFVEKIDNDIYDWAIQRSDIDKPIYHKKQGYYPTYEEATKGLIDRLITIVKEKYGTPIPQED